MQKLSIHKNFLPSFPQDHQTLIQQLIIPHKNQIFLLFSEKIEQDAEKDWVRGRKFLAEMGYKIADQTKKLHQLFQDQPSMNADGKEHLERLVKEIIDMDYESVAQFFGLLLLLFPNPEAKAYFEAIIEWFEALREKSARHTLVISKT